MTQEYQVYFLDTETNGLDPNVHSPVEISIYKLSSGAKSTWHLKPLDVGATAVEALRVNGIKIEDLRGETEEGRRKYREPEKVLVEIENWLMDDFTSPNDRIIGGHNASFDRGMLEALWRRCGSDGTFPFNRKYIVDTFGIEFFLDFCKGKFAEGYNLKSLAKKYGVKNEHAHTAESDTKTAVEVFMKQADMVRKLFGKPASS